MASADSPLASQADARPAQHARRRIPGSSLGKRTFSESFGSGESTEEEEVREQTSRRGSGHASPAAPSILPANLTIGTETLSRPRSSSHLLEIEENRATPAVLTVRDGSVPPPAPHSAESNETPPSSGDSSTTSEQPVVDLTFDGESLEAGHAMSTRTNNTSARRSRNRHPPAVVEIIEDEEERRANAGRVSSIGRTPRRPPEHPAQSEANLVDLTNEDNLAEVQSNDEDVQFIRETTNSQQSQPHTIPGLSDAGLRPYMVRLSPPAAATDSVSHGRDDSNTSNLGSWHAQFFSRLGHDVGSSIYIFRPSGAESQGDQGSGPSMPGTAANWLQAHVRRLPATVSASADLLRESGSPLNGALYLGQRLVGLGHWRPWSTSPSNTSNRPAPSDSHRSSLSPAPRGFTRSPKRTDILVCPKCNEELGEGLDPVQKRMWVVKACGHVYCGNCNKLRGRRKMENAMPRCVVDGCGANIAAPTALLPVFL